jgi:hypothetical protein
MMSGDATCIGSEVLDVNGIIRKCIHLAIIMLREAEECRQRSSIRLELLLKLLAESNERKHGGVVEISWFEVVGTFNGADWASELW